MSVKRYRLHAVIDPVRYGSKVEAKLSVFKHSEGEWVRHKDHAAEVERLRADTQALKYALRLAISGRPVRNADELLAKEG